MIALGSRNIICKVKKKREREKKRGLEGKVCSSFDRESVRVSVCVCVCLLKSCGDNKKIVRTRVKTEDEDTRADFWSRPRFAN